MAIVFIKGTVESVKTEPNRTRIRVREFQYKKKDGSNETNLVEVNKFGHPDIQVGDKIACECKIKSWEKNGFINLSLDCEHIFYDVGESEGNKQEIPPPNFSQKPMSTRSQSQYEPMIEEADFTNY